MSFCVWLLSLVLKIYLHCNECQNSFLRPNTSPLSGWVTLSVSFICGWTLELFPPFGCYESCSDPEPGFWTSSQILVVLSRNSYLLSPESRLQTFYWKRNLEIERMSNKSLSMHSWWNMPWRQQAFHHVQLPSCLMSSFRCAHLCRCLHTCVHCLCPGGWCLTCFSDWEVVSTWLSLSPEVWFSARIPSFLLLFALMHIYHLCVLTFAWCWESQ